MRLEYTEKGEWSTHLKFCVPSRFRNMIDDAQRRWNGGHRTLHIYNENLENILVRLPAELILSIADFLEPFEKALFSLSSKRLRAILTSHFDLALSDADQRFGLVQALEKELPDLLVCRNCAFLFAWRRRKRQNYTCPNTTEPHVFETCHPDSYGYGNRCQPHINMTQEFCDLISRAHRWGPSHGLQASDLTHQFSVSRRRGARSLTGSCEGHIVKNRLFLARSYTFLEDAARFYEGDHCGFRLEVCKHHTWSVNRSHLCRQPSWVQQQTWKSRTSKCTSCATDWRCTFSTTGERKTIQAQVHVWQDYGEFGPSRREFGAMFRYGSSSILSRIFVPSRDLESDFVKSQRPDPERDGEHAQTVE